MDLCIEVVLWSLFDFLSFWGGEEILFFSTKISPDGNVSYSSCLIVSFNFCGHKNGGLFVI